MESCSEKSYKSVKIWQNYGHESVAHSLWSVSFLAHPVVVHDFAGNEVLLQCTVQFTLVLDEMSYSTEFNVVLYASVMKWKLLTDFEVREYETSRFITFFPPFPPEKQMASVTVHQPASTPPHRGRLIVFARWRQCGSHMLRGLRPPELAPNGVTIGSSIFEGSSPVWPTVKAQTAERAISVSTVRICSVCSVGDSGYK